MRTIDPSNGNQLEQRKKTKNIIKNSPKGLFFIFLHYNNLSKKYKY